jgi:tRNA pseudouridine55 synthase
MGRNNPPSISCSGILNVHKPTGLTSHDVVDVVRRAAGTRRVGHAGTLDPAAEGVLLVCVGAATRVSDYLMAGTKRYRATIQFGASSTTDDREGTITASSTPPDFTESDLICSVRTFLGEIDQVPPAYAAIKVAGRPMYERARAGQVVAAPPRRVRIDRISVDSFDRSVAVLEVICSKGTYIRALARDLGRHLSTAAYLAALIRTQSGSFSLSDSVSLDSIRRAGRDGYLGRLLYPIDVAVASWPAIVVDETAATIIANGGRLSERSDLAGENLRAYDETGHLIALLASADSAGGWRPILVFGKDQLDDAA